MCASLIPHWDAHTGKPPQRPPARWEDQHSNIFCNPNDYPKIYQELSSLLVKGQPHFTVLPLLLGSEDVMQRPVVCAPPLSGAFRVEDVNADWHRVVSNIVKQRCTRTRVSYESLLLESRLGQQQLPWSTHTHTRTHTHMRAIALMIDGWFDNYGSTA